MSADSGGHGLLRLSGSLLGALKVAIRIEVRFRGFPRAHERISFLPKCRFEKGLVH